MRRGLLQQVAPPQVLYDTPANLFVAAFIGSPAMNLLEGRIEAEGDGLAVAIGEQRLRLSEASMAARPALRNYIGKVVGFGVRPENLHDPSDMAQHPADQQMKGRVDLREALGSDLIVHFTVAARRVSTEDVKEGGEAGDDEVLHAGEGEAPVVARFDPRSKVADGEVVPIAVDMDRVHYFDFQTRGAIWT
jgi:multiple sugar transport system ATP-binding protein